MKTSEKIGTLLIPDISGFTQFVSEVELSHSQHIIAELLEVIIDANHLGFEISEIEGDAILFYRFGPPPSVLALQEQAETFFLKFHQSIRQIKRDTLCKCGACQNVGALTLKVVAHYGEMSLTKIKNRVKLIGKDVIFAHRLLKNSISSSEYLLVTHPLLQATGGDGSAPAQMQAHRETYAHLGELLMYVQTLSHLQSQVLPPPEPQHRSAFPNPIVVTKKINAPLEAIYALLLDFEKLPEWNPGMKRVEHDRHAPVRIGTSHNCIVEGGDVLFTLDKIAEQKDEIILTNRVQMRAPMAQVSATYHLRRENGQTDLTFIFSYKRYPVIGGLIDKILRPRLAQNFTETHQRLKEHAETTFAKLSLLQ